MKANKALKRITNIETLISDLTARYSPTSRRIRGVLEEAKAAVTLAKEALSLQAAAKTDREEKKAAPAGKKVAVKRGRKKVAMKKVAAKATIAKSAKKRAPIKRVAKKKAATMTAAAAVHAVPEAGGPSAPTGEVE